MARVAAMPRTLTPAIARMLLAGTVLGALAGLVIGLLDGGAFVAWMMLLGACGGAASGVGGAAIGAVAMFLLRSADPRSRVLGVAAGVGLGAGATFLLLATRVPLVAPWPTVGAAMVLLIAGLSAYPTLSERAAGVEPLS